MRKFAVILAVWTAMVIACPTVHAEAAGCAKFRESIEHQKKGVSLVTSGAPADNSAPRETNRNLDAVMFLLVMNMNLSLMAQNGCKPLSEPIQVSEYAIPALKCSLERTKGIANPKECDTATWRK